MVDGSAADVASDKAGEPRSDLATVPPPGTAVPGFWERDSTKGAIAVTIGIGVSIGKAYILGLPPAPESLANSMEMFVWAWAAAIGLAKTGSDTLKWK